MRAVIGCALMLGMIIACEKKPQPAAAASPHGSMAALKAPASPAQRSLIQRKRASQIRNTLAKALVLDPEFWAEHGEVLTRRFSDWRRGLQL